MELVHHANLFEVQLVCLSTVIWHVVNITWIYRFIGVYWSKIASSCNVQNKLWSRQLDSFRQGSWIFLDGDWTVFFLVAGWQSGEVGDTHVFSIKREQNFRSSIMKFWPKGSSYSFVLNLTWSWQLWDWQDTPRKGKEKKTKRNTIYAHDILSIQELDHNCITW